MSQESEKPSVANLDQAEFQHWTTLVQGPPVNQYMLRQIQLATEKYQRDHPEDVLFADPEVRNKIMEEWASSKYSPAFESIFKSPQFIDHTRFKGSLANVVLDDVASMVKDQRLPAN